MSIALIAAALLWSQDPTGSAAIDACRGPGAPIDAEHAEDAIDCLVTAIYAPGQLELIEPLGDDAARLFSRAALADLTAAQARAGGEVAPGLDADPFCACQDAGGLTILVRATQVSSDGTGSVAIVFTFQPVTENMTTEELEALLLPENRTSLRLDLVHEGDGWRVDDIVGGEGGSFRQSLQP